MNSSTEFDTVISEWSIAYIEGSWVIMILIKKYIVFLSLKISFVLANSADPEQMLYNAFGSSMFAKVHIRGFPVYKG